MNEYIAGAMSGLSSAIIGHPLETCKNNIQNKTKIILTPKFLMKGILPSCKANIIQNSLIFGFNNNLLSYTNNPFITGAPLALLHSYFLPG